MATSAVRVKTNRTVAICPRCGGEEIIAAENELVACSLCVQLRAGSYSNSAGRPSGKELKKLREDKKLSVKDLAHRLGVAQSYLYEMEEGKKPVNTAAYKWMTENGATPA